jgi:hypothetical protein
MKKFITTQKGRVTMLALMIATAAVIAVGVFIISRKDSDPFRADAIVDPPFTSLTYSIQAFLWWDVNGRSGTHMDWVKLLGFSHVKQTFAWKDVEPIPGQWFFTEGDRILNELERRDLSLIVRLTDTPDWAHPSLPPIAEGGYIDAPPDNLDDWANYCHTVADRYKGRVAAYQIWNEPNLSREWGGKTPEAAGYVEMLRRCSDEIRAVDPDAILISAGLSPTGQDDSIAQRDDLYLQRMYDLDFQQYIDVVGVHAPGFAPPEYGPDDAERDGRGRWATFRRVEDLREIMVKNGDAARQMAILEVGYTTDQTNPVYSWFAVTEEEQADMMVRAYRYAAENWRPWVGLMSTIYIANPNWTQENEEFWWAIDQPRTWVTRPVFAALTQMEKYCGDIIVPDRYLEDSSVAREYNPCH